MIFQRVMASGFFVLLRFFLRVDGVLVRMNDTRIYHQVRAIHTTCCLGYSLIAHRLALTTSYESIHQKRPEQQN